MNSLESGVAKKLDIEDIESLDIKEEACTFHDNHIDDIKEDYKFIRKKLRRSVVASEAVLEQALKDIQINPGPRVVEGCAQIIKITIESCKELQNIHEKQAKINKINPPKKENPTGDNDDDKSITSSLNEIISRLNKENSND